MAILPLAPDQTIAQMWSNGARGGGGLNANVQNFTWQPITARPRICMVCPTSTGAESPQHQKFYMYSPNVWPNFTIFVHLINNNQESPAHETGGMSPGTCIYWRTVSYLCAALVKTLKTDLDEIHGLSSYWAYLEIHYVSWGLQFLLTMERQPFTCESHKHYQQNNHK